MMPKCQPIVKHFILKLLVGQHVELQFNSNNGIGPICTIVDVLIFKQNTIKS